MPQTITLFLIVLKKCAESRAILNIIKTLKGTGPNNEEEVLENNNPVEVIAKVILNYNIKLFK